MLARWSTDTSTSGGSSDTDTKALAVMAWVRSWCRVVTIVTPLAKRPSAARNWRLSTTAVFHHDVDIVRIDQIRHGPAIQIVFSHALFGEALVLGGLAQMLRHHQGFKAHALVAPEVVTLIER